MSRGTAYYDLPNGERIELPTTMPDVEEVPGPLCDGKFELPEAVKEKDLCEAMIRQIRAKPIFSDSGEPLLDCQSERRAAEPDLREGGQSEDQN